MPGFAFAYCDANAALAFANGEGARRYDVVGADARLRPSEFELRPRADAPSKRAFVFRADVEADKAAWLGALGADGGGGKGASAAAPPPPPGGASAAEDDEDD